MVNQKSTKNVNQNGLLSRVSGSKLTARELNIIHTLQSVGGNTRLASQRLGNISKQYLSKVRIKAEKSGLYRGLVNMVDAGGVTGQPCQPNKYNSATQSQMSNKNDPSSHIMRRLHAEKFVLELIRPISEKWKIHINNQFRLDDTTVVCHPESITILSSSSFYGKTEILALAQSVQFWENFLVRLENHLGVLLIKDRKENLKRVYAEWETIDTVIGQTVAKECDDNIKIYDHVDGKLRFTTDMSLRTQNHETHHHQKGMRDSENVGRFVEDFLEQPQAPTLSELARLVGNLAKQNVETASGLTAIIQLMKPKSESKPEEKPSIRPSYLV